jgi:voltage-gated potassium channel
LPVGQREETLPRRFLVPLAALIALTTLGTAAYVVLEGLSLVDALYLTTVTISTVGYGDIVPKTPAGKLLTVTLIFLGVGVALYWLGTLAELLVEGKLRELLGRNAMQRELSKFHGHVIVCGYGRFGRAVVEELTRGRARCVILDSNPALRDDLEAEGVPYLIGSALSEDVLESARLAHAKAIVLAIPSDSDNVFITLSARERNPAIRVHARAESEAGARRLRLAGADQVISAYQSGGSRIAAAIVRPAVVDFLEISTLGHDERVALEEIRVGSRSAIVGRPLGAIEHDHPRVRIIALKRADEAMSITPDPKNRVADGDFLVVVGERAGLDDLAQLAQGQEVAG